MYSDFFRVNDQTYNDYLFSYCIMKELLCLFEVCNLLHLHIFYFSVSIDSSSHEYTHTHTLYFSAAK